MIKFRASISYRPKIERLEVVRITPTMYVFDKGGYERREQPWTVDHRWFDDFDSAKAYVVGHYESKAKEANLLLADAHAIEAPHA